MAQNELAHLLHIGFYPDGIALLPIVEKGGAALPAVRFPLAYTYGDSTLALWGNPKQGGTDFDYIPKT